MPKQRSELDVFKAIVTALAGLTPEECERVLAYIVDKYKAQLPEASGK